MNEGPGAAPVPRNVASLNRGEKLSVGNMVAHHNEEDTLRISSPHPQELPPLAIRNGSIVDE